MGASVSGQIGKSRALPRQQLLEIWKKVYGRAAPLGIRRELLVPFLAYRIQENALGGLPPRVSAELSQIIRAFSKNGSLGSLSQPALRAGTRLLRSWRGETHEIDVTDVGYEYRGTCYRSLSEIARKITGTRWSGPAFFGLKTATVLRGGNHDSWFDRRATGLSEGRNSAKTCFTSVSEIDISG